MPKLNLFDQTLKIIARNYAGTFIQLAFPDIPLYLMGTVENVELALPVRPVDFVHRVQHEDQEYILHLEFQLEHSAGFPARMCLYHGTLTELFNLPVLSLALYLKPRKAPIPNEYTVRVGKQAINRFTYPVLRLWDYVDDIRSGKLRELAPLLVMLVQEPDVDLLTLERKLVLAEPEPKKRADLLSLAVTVAARYFEKDFLWRFFREELDMLKGTSFIDDWIQEAAEQGVQTTLRKDVMRILGARFQLASKQEKQITQQLETIREVAALESLVEHAIRDITLTDFQTRVQQTVENRPPA